MRIVVAVACLVLVAGCSPSGGPTQPSSPASSPTPSPTTTSANPSPSPSPTRSTSPSPSPAVTPSYPANLPTQDPDAAAAIAAWQEYTRVYEMFMADPTLYTDYTDMRVLVTGDEVEEMFGQLSKFKERGWKVVGGQVFRDVTVERLGDSSPRQINIAYCADTSDIQVIDIETGKAQERTALTYRETATMEEGEDGRWRVSLIQNQPATC